MDYVTFKKTKKHRHVLTKRKLLAAFWGFWATILLSGASYALSQSEARHLLARTGFSLPRLAEIEAIIPLTRMEAVDFLLNQFKTMPRTPAPHWVEELPPPYKQRKSWSSVQRRTFNMQNRERLRELQSWWVTELLNTESPLTENLVLFWHNHFTSSFHSVKWVPFLYRQNLMLRQHALGDFKLILNAIVTDPAMLFFLDGRRNHAKQPNENFAREFFELFTLGEGNGYVEKDIQEAARAFTGWVVRPDSTDAIFKRRRHDGGLKTILGKTGRFNASDVISIIAEHPRVSVYIAEKFFNAYIGGEIDRDELQRLAGVFRHSDYSVRALFRATLLSEVFWHKSRRGVIIKSPSDTVIGLARLVRWKGGTKFLVKMMKNMGQELFYPPNVKGWPGGETWITTNYLSARNQFTARLLRDLGSRKINENMAMKSTAGNGLTKMAMGLDMDSSKLASIMLAIPPVQKFLVHSAPPTARIGALMQDPAFQMK